MNKNLLFTLLFIFSINFTIGQATKIDTSHTFKTNTLALDLDGAKHAYHPNNEGLDYNENGGISKEEAINNKFDKGRGYGIAKKRINHTTQYKGYIQPDGYFVSQTTPYNKSQPDSSYTKYADAETIPYIALSPAWKKRGMQNCDIAVVVNLDNGKNCAAIFADYRGNDKATEISLALAQALEIPVITKQGSSYDNKKKVTRYVGIKNKNLKIYYFTGSGDGNGKTPEQIQQIGLELMGQ